MQQFRFDWRWIAAIVVIAIIVAGQRVPWPIFMLALAGSGGYLLYMGWQIWNGAGSSGSKRVTYWRGQRIELEPERRSGMPPLRAITPAIIYLVLGGILVLGAVSVFLRQVGA
jgi:hypothetical protein